jgi:hypothetical protein
LPLTSHLPVWECRNIRYGTTHSTSGRAKIATDGTPPATRFTSERSRDRPSVGERSSGTAAANASGTARISPSGRVRNANPTHRPDAAMRHRRAHPSWDDAEMTNHTPATSSRV